jgi:hypothetical protein
MDLFLQRWDGWRWSGPVAFRKHAPGLTDRWVSAPRSRLDNNMNQLSGTRKTIDGVFAVLRGAAKPAVRHFETGIGGAARCPVYARSPSSSKVPPKPAHPILTRARHLSNAPSPIRLPLVVNLQDDTRDLASVGAVRIGIKHA